MPAKNARDPNSRRARVLRYYEEHVGFHRCADVAAAIGETTHGVAVDSWSLWKQGDLTRDIAPAKTPGARPHRVYGIDRQ